jgi:uncharacterized membrane protein YedE/YeeE
MTEKSIISKVSTSRSHGKKKSKINQIPIGLLVLAIMIGITLWLNTKSSNLVLFWVTGLAFGFILQRSRFCFTASLRDPYLTGSTSLTKAVLIAFALTSIGFAAIQYGTGVEPYIAPLSLATCIGAFMFGIGMVVAGGCASGTLMRVGEGFFMNMIALIFFIVGSLIGAYHTGFWDYNFRVNAPQISLYSGALGILGGVLANLAIIAVVYVIAHKWGNRKKND